MRSRWTKGLLATALSLGIAFGADAESAQLWWGDTHLHTNNSFDAYLNRNFSADPATAYRYAKGLPVIHPFHRARVQIQTPLDFLVVADHAEFYGVMRHIMDRGIPRDDLGPVDSFRAFMSERWLRGVIEDDEGNAAFQSFLPGPGTVEEAAAQGRDTPIPNTELMQRTVWREAVATADAFNQPGVFTALIGWEWSSIPAGANLHRVVVTDADAEAASRFEPFSSTQSMYPEDLWAWLAETSTRIGADFLAIPHNSNISKGYMFGETSLRGEPYGAESARLRAQWEPVVEATQFKGDSEAHPDLSPADPFADFETYPHYIQNEPPPYEAKPGDYVRSGLRRGLAIEKRTGVNPYRFGLIGSTDSHTGIASAEEPNFWGKMARDSIPENKADFRRGVAGATGWSMSASGLAAVWAPENTRESLLEAFRRREIYATTGSRIALRVFGGWDFEAADVESGGLAERGYARGVPMGGLLPPAPQGAAPRFLVQALRDPKSAPLDRIQIVKGWIDASGRTHERVFDVAWWGDRKPGPKGALPPIRSGVDPATGRVDPEVGSPELRAVWKDPAFEPGQAAFYYVRVLEAPTPRHSLYDALALGIDPEETGQPVTIQERAYASPIWYRP